MDRSRRGVGSFAWLAAVLSVGVVAVPLMLWLFGHAAGEPIGENEPPIAAELSGERLRVVLGNCDAFDSASVTVTAGPDGDRLGEEGATIWSGPVSAARGVVDVRDVRLPTTRTEWIIIQVTTTQGDASSDYFLAVAPAELATGADRSGGLSSGEFERRFTQCEQRA